MGTQESPRTELGLCLQESGEAGLCVREKSVQNEWDPVSLAPGLGKQWDWVPNPGTRCTWQVQNLSSTFYPPR